MGAWSYVDRRIETASLTVFKHKVPVRVVARNLPELEVRMHRVEPEAYVRAGGTPQDLLTLDVAVIVPDARWKAPVPGYQAQRDQAFDLPVNVPGPGIYVVTVSGPEQEASAVLLVSDLDLVARTVGPDAALAVFRGGRPVSGAKLLLGGGSKSYKSWALIDLAVSVATASSTATPFSTTSCPSATVAAAASTSTAFRASAAFAGIRRKQADIQSGRCGVRRCAKHMAENFVLKIIRKTHPNVLMRGFSLDEPIRARSSAIRISSTSFSYKEVQMAVRSSSFKYGAD
jgi:hypothetical protein